MLSAWLVLAITAAPCPSDFEQKAPVTVVYQCQKPLVQGLPNWWRPGMADKAEPTAVAKPKKIVKKKYKRKRRHRK